jgi:hypothetical protein
MVVRCITRLCGASTFTLGHIALVMKTLNGSSV